jgi:hypothetical protein
MKYLYQSAAVFTVFLVVSLAVIPASPAATTIAVTSAADSGGGTLRAALANAADGDTIIFSLPTPATVILTSGELQITRNVTVTGPAVVGFASGGFFNRVFHINANTIVTMSGLTVTGSGSGISGAGIFNDSATLTLSNCFISNSFGGGVDNEASSANASVTLVNSIVSGNTAQFGGGIYNYAPSGIASVTLVNSTVSGNLSQIGGGIVNLSQGGAVNLTLQGSTICSNSAQFAGGIWNIAQGGSANTAIFNSTVSGNSANFAGAIWNEAEGGGSIADLQVANSTFSGNSGSAGAGGIWNSFDSGGSAMAKIGSTIFNSGESGANLVNDSGAIFTTDGYNLSSDDGAGVLTAATDQTNTNPALGPLQDNGGPTFTHALLAGSPAIDHGKNLNGLTFDQRDLGFVRTFDDPGVQNPINGDGTDVGSFEAQFSLQDTTPPILTCPSDLIVEATSNAGAVVNFSVFATDISDPAPEVISVPASGSLFPIGTTVVECSARDASGNTTSNSFTVTVLGAKSILANVLAELVNLRATVSDRSDAKMLDAVISHLGKSLDSALWINETHLQPKSGEKIFQEDSMAVAKLSNLIKSKKSGLTDLDLQSFIDRIVRADRLLGSVAIQDAVTAGVASKKIGQIQKYLDKGDAKISDADFGNAIQGYGSAWKLAIHAGFCL